MERHFDKELEELHQHLYKMGDLTKIAIKRAIKALRNKDKELAQIVITDDKEIDALEIKIEEEIIDLLALYQPMAGDLRFITMGIRINSELERMADLAVNISQRILEFSYQEELPLLEEIDKLEENTREMVKESIKSFVKSDVELAKKVIEKDAISNELRNIIVKELTDKYMIRDGKILKESISLLLIARDLERIGDLASAIAKDVIYVVNAEIVKHKS